MQDISAYASDNDFLRLLLQGAPGSGKTDLACRFPSPYVIDVDVNLGGVLRRLRRDNLPLPVGFDIIDKDEKGLAIPMPARFQRLERCLNEIQSNPKVQTIIIDSGTTLVDVLIAEVCRKQGKTQISDWKDGRQFWNFFAPFCRQFFGMLTGLRRHIVLVVHESIQKNEAGAVVYPTKIAWPGQVGQNLGAFFTNNWRCENQREGFGPTEKTKYLIRTSPDGRYELKNTLGLPSVMEFDWKVIQEALDKGK